MIPYQHGYIVKRGAGGSAGVLGVGIAVLQEHRHLLMTLLHLRSWI
tara:strand:+ start:329 stop:466 length:138 start_codon:yes stop_codon:yes gene_type:complete